MNRTVILLLGLISIALLLFFCVRNHAPLIQKDILNRVSTVLSPAPTDWTKVSVDGRNVLLTGVAPSELLREKADKMARAVTGVVSIDNQITVVKVIPKPVVISPYTSSFSKEGSVIVLSGLVPNEDQRNTLFQHAEQKFGIGNVTDQLVIDSAAPQGWLEAAKLGISNLALFNNGSANLTDTEIYLSGNVINEAAKFTIEQELQKLLPANFNANYDLTAPQLELVIQTVSTCSEQFDKKITAQTIRFTTDNSQVDVKAKKTLDEILEFSVSCPNSIIQVAGHTDGRGSSSYNMKLSVKRTEAVVKSLIERGMSENKLKAVGFGETKPLSKNTSSLGQANNRRIEFKYLQEGK